MKKISSIILAMLTLAACQEFEPVFTSKYDAPAREKVWTESEVTAKYGKIITIAELAAKYEQEKSWNMDEDLVISGIITTTDQPGNFYKSFYIQDATGGMEIKIGKNGLYNDFPQGMRVWVVCRDLTLGMYGYKSGDKYGMGMVQVGASRNVKDDGSFADKYETSYIENAIVINTHVLKGEIEEQVAPVPISSASELPVGLSDTQATNSKVGALVTMKGLTYGNEVFALLYLDSNKDKESYTNRIFLSDSNGTSETCPTHNVAHGKTHGITTWAMSKVKLTELMLMGCWDGCKVGSGANYLKDDAGNYVTVGSLKGEDGKYTAIEKIAVSLSQYFKLDGKSVQIRTSGYSKFSDLEIPADVLSGRRTIDVTGVLTLYQGSIQLTVNSAADFKYSDGTPLYPGMK
ncbi:MAG: DUF5689 domain-containing protein [Bacteroidales bacterium]|nr:DUF5689 domain-containing protein [Bacteroidales bacterium]